MVVPAAVAVLRKPSIKLFDVKLALESLAAKVEAVAAEATPEPVASPVIAGVVKAGEVIVCTPVNVFAASVRAMVALVLGNVIVVPSVPARVKELLIVSVLLAAPKASVPSLVVTVRPFVKVKVFPSVPASVILLLAVKVFPEATVKVPVVLVMVTPLMEVAVAAPSEGVVKAGLVANTKSPLPVAPVLVTPSMVW